MKKQECGSEGVLAAAPSKKKQNEKLVKHIVLKHVVVRQVFVNHALVNHVDESLGDDSRTTLSFDRASDRASG